MTVQTKFTYEDYLLFPDDGRRHELIDGDHYMTPAPSTAHQRILLKVAHRIAAHLDRYPLDHLYTAPTDVVLSKTDVIQPDLLFVSSARASLVTSQNIQGAPDLAVEILSEATRRTDEIIKRKLYERFGVQEYWIIDPEIETIKIYRMTAQGYHRVAELSDEADDMLSTPLLPDLSIPLKDIFA
ncbi:MAG: Uma2 family endonuclease [Candidatus Methylomirabilis oxyfera]|nr:Uma2 family endonuclease [Candidatus Methylomirabilis oxyfera]